MGKAVGIISTIAQLLGVASFAIDPSVQAFWSHHPTAGVLAVAILQVVSHLAPNPVKSTVPQQ